VAGSVTLSFSTFVAPAAIDTFTRGRLPRENDLAGSGVPSAAGAALDANRSRLTVPFAGTFPEFRTGSDTLPARPGRRVTCGGVPAAGARVTTGLAMWTVAGGPPTTTRPAPATGAPAASATTK